MNKNLLFYDKIQTTLLFFLTKMWGGGGGQNGVHVFGDF